MSELVLPCFWIAAGLTLLVVGGELLVRGAATLAASAKIDPLVIGLTVVAFGTSAPELAVSVQAAFAGKADLALGNVVGSNIANVLLILGASALIAPLSVASRLIRLDVPVMIGASVLLLVLAWDGTIDWIDGAVFFFGLLTYLGWLARQSRKERDSVDFDLPESAENAKLTLGNVIKNIVYVGVAAVLLSGGSNWLVSGATDIALIFGVPELVIGLTIVALGTSLPELAASVTASLRGERDIAVGNCVGSNILNIFAVMGITGMVAPNGVPAPPIALQVDIPIMIAVAFACLPIFFVRRCIFRWEGAIFVGYYFAYNGYLILVESKAPIADSYAVAMLGVVVPLTVVTLLALSVQAIRADRRKARLAKDQDAESTS